MESKFGSITGIIYRTFPAQEADKVVYLLTEAGEKLTCVGKGARKSTSRKAHAIDLLNEVTIKTTGKASGREGLEMITEARLLDQNLQWKKGLSHLAAAQLICELTDKFTQDGVAEQPLYLNLKNLLEVRQPKRPALLVAALLLRFLYTTGHLPQIDIDLTSGEKLSPEMTLHSPQIGYTHEPIGEEVPTTVIKIQKYMLSHQFADIDNLAVNASQQLEILQLHNKWFEFALQTELKSLELFITTLI